MTSLAIFTQTLTRLVEKKLERKNGNVFLDMYEKIDSDTLETLASWIDAKCHTKLSILIKSILDPNVLVPSKETLLRIKKQLNLAQTLQEENNMEHLPPTPEDKKLLNEYRELSATPEALNYKEYQRLEEVTKALRDKGLLS